MRSSLLTRSRRSTSRFSRADSICRRSSCTPLFIRSSIPAISREARSCASRRSRISACKPRVLESASSPIALTAISSLLASSCRRCVSSARSCLHCVDQDAKLLISARIWITSCENVLICSRTRVHCWWKSSACFKSWLAACSSQSCCRFVKTSAMLLLSSDRTEAPQSKFLPRSSPKTEDTAESNFAVVLLAEEENMLLNSPTLVSPGGELCSISLLPHMARGCACSLCEGQPATNPVVSCPAWGRTRLKRAHNGT
mmetsp:Transcript_105809/g.203502  ORF Transcript_105809/g.203502 Transcript_105809/m.203502 type:complete len:257 (-) Transcript_105809:44-814(-)